MIFAYIVDAVCGIVIITLCMCCWWDEFRRNEQDTIAAITAPTTLSAPTTLYTPSNDTSRRINEVTQKVAQSSDADLIALNDSV